jgi:hypothetical protein
MDTLSFFLLESLSYEPPLRSKFLSKNKVPETKTFQFSTIYIPIQKSDTAAATRKRQEAGEDH